MCLLLSLFANVPKVKAATFTVSNTNESGSGSLRQAIIDANTTSIADDIDFNIPGDGKKQIIPTSPMPAITRPVTINGTTQPCSSCGASEPRIELSGNGAGSSAIGLRITGNGAGSTIRGMIINRFSSNGIFLDSGNNTIVGNYIGTNAAGTDAAANSGDGIGIFSGTNLVDASNNVIGGTVAADRNIISGNAQNGIGITAQDGGSASSNTISGNYIGTNATGNSAVANGGDGILVNHAQGSATLSGNTIGGTVGVTVGGGCTGACNLISGNQVNGVGLWHSGVTSTAVSGNYVGINASGTSAIYNGDIGLEIQETANNTIGGTVAEARNVISGNLGAGIFITGDGATGNTVLGNYVGTNSAGNADVGNIKMGIGIGYSPGIQPAHDNNIGSATGTTPGGSCTGGCNLISGNDQNGVLIIGPGGNQLRGNYIGTNATGTGNIKNALDGIGVADSPNNGIGNGTSNGRNVISANGDNGVIITGGTGNRIDGNYIGLASDGGSLGNTGAGVMLAGGTDTAIVGNGIGYNVKLGIDLGYNNVSLNDGGDSDGGANRTQNFPNVYAAKTVGSNTKVGGQFNGAPSTSFQLEFFSSNSCNAGVTLNYGEGQTYIGSTSVTTDVYGNTAFSFTPGSSVPGGQYITATATKKIGSTPAETSEFSLCRLVNIDRPALTNGATWFLKNDLTSGSADQTFGYGFPSYFLMCAWDPNQPGVKLPVIFSVGSWFMRASYTTGNADLSFSYGASNAKPVCGDWNGDGTETVGVVSPDSTWNLRDSNSIGPADAGSFQYGPFPSTPVVGDWDGDGDDNVGVFFGDNSWSERNTNSAGPATSEFNFGFVPSYPVVGDWDGNGTDTVGSVSTGGTWSLRNSNSSGATSATFQFGFPTTKPLVW